MVPIHHKSADTNIVTLADRRTAVARYDGGYD